MKTFPSASLTLALAASLVACHKAPPPPPPPAPVAAVVVPVKEPEPPVMPETPSVRESIRLLSRDTLGALLSRMNVSADEGARLITAMHKVLDPRRMRPSDVVTVRMEGSALRLLTVERYREDGVPQTIKVASDGKGGFVAQASAPEVRVVQEQLSGVVKGTLYDTMVALKESPALINQFVDVFDSQVDFYREVQNGDVFKLVVEKRYAGDRLIGYGRVLAAEFRQSWRTLHGFHFVGPDGVAGHYDEKGRSLLTAFLKTPMEFTRITSSYGMRFHPVLKERKAHNGVDYGAPTGTPIWTVGDGRVVTARDEGACGNAVMIQHPNGMLTGYCHLSRFGAGIREGVHVTQRQVIGYVGTTGRSTAPHLHFLMKKGGAFVNPQKIEAPRKQGLSGAELVEFRKHLPQLLGALESIPSA